MWNVIGCVGYEKQKKKIKIKEKKGRNKGDSLVSDMKKENKNKRKKRTNCELCKVANILNDKWLTPVNLFKHNGKKNPNWI